MERNASEYLWELFNEYLTNQYHGFKALLAYLQQQFNQSQPDTIHTFQNLYGCDWDSASGHKDAYHHHGYDGKDLMDGHEDWDAEVGGGPAEVGGGPAEVGGGPAEVGGGPAEVGGGPAEVGGGHARSRASGQEVEQSDKRTEILEVVFTKECPEMLRKYVSYARETLERIAPPSISLFQSAPSSPVSCLASGFYPREALIYWTKAGVEHHEDVEYRDTLPNPDGTLQLRSLLSVRREEWKESNLSCVVQHQGREVTIPLDPSKVITNWTRHPTLAPGLSPGLVGAVVGVVLTVLSILAGLVFWSRGRRRQQ
ncbi:LOW QUALITY PROTEIN: HLA class I histocompatibility antigen, alpha chain F-like [Osmerus eperlanus]|uniref:LOW QUALITY PROTEIN: HLA class I histocompatibility antigen, alpha chain F-like n=1 Tax=Osmerus eperlanus TaxID=29151 RepID=UPI002E1061C8